MNSLEVNVKSYITKKLRFYTSSFFVKSLKTGLKKLITLKHVERVEYNLTGKTVLEAIIFEW